MNIDYKKPCKRNASFLGGYASEEIQISTAENQDNFLLHQTWFVTGGWKEMHVVFSKRDTKRKKLGKKTFGEYGIFETQQLWLLVLVFNKELIEISNAIKWYSNFWMERSRYYKKKDTWENTINKCCNFSFCRFWKRHLRTTSQAGHHLPAALLQVTAGLLHCKGFVVKSQKSSGLFVACNAWNSNGINE